MVLFDQSNFQFQHTAIQGTQMSSENFLPGDVSNPSNPLTIRSVLQWRDTQIPEGGVCRDVWTPLEEFFLQHNYTLWKKPRILGNWDSFYVYPPRREISRTHDGFVYRTKYNSEADDRERCFPLTDTIHCPARTSDNRDVLIRLVHVDNDPVGDDHLTILHRLATGNNAFRGDNHALPVLQELKHDGMTFAVFPLVFEYSGFTSPWYYNFGELVDAIEQVLEGVYFCHEHLVAHLDIADDNILINFVGGAMQDVEIRPVRGAPPQPFRSYFPIRYYLNDFDLSVYFEYDSEPSSRVVTGVPTKGKRSVAYGRDAAPEMLSDAPYCPFRADIWQLGDMFNKYFVQVKISATLQDLFTDMRSSEPSSRPTASEALERVRRLRREMSAETRDSHIPRPDWDELDRLFMLRAKQAEAMAVV